MSSIRLALVGAGNIMTTRHLPALRSQEKLFNLIGVLDRSEEKAKLLAQAAGAPHWGCSADPSRLSSLSWLREAEAALVATPPMVHEPLVNELLQLGKHVLVEKPFVLDLAVGEALIRKAQEQRLILALNHNFQFSRSFQQLEQLIKTGKLGAVRSFYSVQFSNDTRRLPAWAEELPLGLFYDESPHVFYLLRRFGKGEPTIQHARAVRSQKTANTPQVLDIEISTPVAPAHVYINFESPICEWYFTVFGESHVANVDMFRDILTVLPNDGQHLMKEVFRTSALLTWYHWKGFISSGVRYVQRKLHYGMDVTQQRFHRAVCHSDPSALENMDGLAGVAVNRAQHEVMAQVAKRAAPRPSVG